MSTEVPGGSKPLRRWEYYYWGLGVSAVSYFLYRNLAKPDETPEQIEVRGSSSSSRGARQPTDLLGSGSSSSSSRG
jgi:hypothetical protein